MARPLRPEHLQAAFQAMAWEGWTYEAAMADDVRRRVVQLRARQIAGRDAFTRRYIARPLVRLLVRDVTDLKRAAAGDRDD